MNVFKYRGGDNEIFKRDLDALKNNLFYASDSESLNDPCEAISNPDRFIRQTAPFNSILGVKSQEQINFLNENTINVLSFDKNMGIYSLSRTFNDEILWTHYANSHKGFCVEYDLDGLLKKKDADILDAFEVKYCKKPQDIGFLDVVTHANKKMLRKMCGFKSKRWEYEKEYRIITNQYGLKSYEEQSLTSIYFGLRMIEDHKKEIMSTLSGRDVNFFQMELLKNSYEFKAVPVEIHKL